MATALLTGILTTPPLQTGGPFHLHTDGHDPPEHGHSTNGSDSESSVSTADTASRSTAELSPSRVDRAAEHAAESSPPAAGPYASASHLDYRRAAEAPRPPANPLDLHGDAYIAA
jgi:hypothetical protein